MKEAAFFSEATPTRVLVKICGLRRAEDVDAAVAAGADAIGFNFWPGSKRYLSPSLAAPLVLRLPPSVVAVGVFVNPTLEAVKEAMTASGVTAVQLHGEEPPELLRALRVPTVKAIGVATEADLLAVPRYAAAGARLFLLDAKSDAYGGTGSPFDWSLAGAKVLAGHRVVLAGGLNPKNVGFAVRAVRPFAVDTASGVETSPGIKDPEQMIAFVRAAREVSERNPL